MEAISPMYTARADEPGVADGCAAGTASSAQEEMCVQVPVPSSHAQQLRRMIAELEWAERTLEARARSSSADKKS
jgi:hypothetical protein